MARLLGPLPLLPLCRWPQVPPPYPFRPRCPSLSAVLILFVYPSCPLAASHLPSLGAGGAAEAEAAYEEAFDAIFNLAVESYRHPIPQISKKNGQQKWSMIEMWPMSVSVCELFAFHVYVCVCLHVCASMCALLLADHRPASPCYRLGSEWHQPKNHSGCFVSMQSAPVQPIGLPSQARH